MSDFTAYHFSNFYLSPIQHGIQAAHCQTSMAKKYKGSGGSESSIFWNWVDNPVMICLNGGSHEDLLSVQSTVKDFATAISLPFCDFHEDWQSLNSLLTNVGVIVPEKFTSAYRLLVNNSTSKSLQEFMPQESNSETYLDFCKIHGALNIREVEFIDYLRGFSLAR